MRGQNCCSRQKGQGSHDYWLHHALLFALAAKDRESFLKDCG
jgi:hypothetical protein